MIVTVVLLLIQAHTHTHTHTHTMLCLLPHSIVLFSFIYSYTHTHIFIIILPPTHPLTNTSCLLDSLLFIHLTCTHTYVVSFLLLPSLTHPTHTDYSLFFMTNTHIGILHLSTQIVVHYLTISLLKKA
jgi:hypothetical protein